MSIAIVVERVVIAYLHIFEVAVAVAVAGVGGIACHQKNLGNYVLAVVEVVVEEQRRKVIEWIVLNLVSIELQALVLRSKVCSGEVPRNRRNPTPTMNPPVLSAWEERVRFLEKVSKELTPRCLLEEVVGLHPRIDLVVVLFGCVMDLGKASKR